MNTIAWIIVVLNMNYGTVRPDGDVKFASKQECETVLAELESVHARSRTLKYRCAPVVVPVVISEARK